MKNIKKSKNEEMNKKWEKMKKARKKTKKTGEKSRKKKEKRAQRGTTRDGPKNWFFTSELSTEIVTKLRPKKN